MTPELVALCAATIAVTSVACVWLERARPIQRVDHRAVWLRDVAAALTYVAIVIPVARLLADQLPHVAVDWRIPLGVRVGVFYVLADLAIYACHRAMHSELLWRTHRWHHVPTYMYWLAGARSSLTQQLMFNLPAILLVPLLAPAPAWLYVVLPIEAIVRNQWVHLNVALDSRWLEWVIVTPRCHRLHHSFDHRGNYGSLLTIWDRLFGTWLDPDLHTVRRLGIADEEHAVRVMVGI